MRRRAGLLLAMIGLLALPATVGAHLDHAPPAFNEPAPPAPTFISGGEDAEWELVATLPTANPLTDIDFFTQGGNTYASAGTLGTGPNGGGQTIAQLTDGDEVNPRVVSNHPSASCISEPSAALGLQHDIEATPKGGSFPLNTFNPGADDRQAQLLVDATDAAGRCHDGGIAGVVNAPAGGLELLDVNELLNPTDDGFTSEIGLTSHIGEAHTVNIDPRRPHIAYSVTSDAVTVRDTDNDDVPDQRGNELETTPNPVTGAEQPNADRFDLDGFEVVDMSSCMNFPAGMSLAEKREACRPEVFRYRYPTLSMSQGHTNKGSVYGCHELEVYPDDRLSCASGGALIVLDMADAFDDNGTPNDFTDDKPQGDPLPCKLRESSSVGSFSTGAMITDCVDGEDLDGDAIDEPDDLSVAKWLQDGAPSLEGVEYIGTAFHQGRNASDQIPPEYDSTEDIDFNHEAEFTTSRKFLLATDERGGGVAPPGATCPPAPGDNPIGNGGIHAYRADALRTSSGSPEEAFQSYANSSPGQGDGAEDRAIYRATIHNPQPQASLCTAHVFQQIPGQNRIFMGWYSQGTQVVDFVENPDGTIDFKEAGYFIPSNANTWVSHIFKAQENPDGSFTYWGATGDFNISGQGRSAMDVYKVTLPGPQTPQGGTGAAGAPPLVDDSAAPGTPAAPGSPAAPGAPAAPAAPGGGSDEETCATIAGFRRVNASRRGRGLRIGFARRNSRRVQVDVFRQTRGKRSITRLKRIKQFRNRKRSFNWRARGVRNGYYVLRYRIGLSGGDADVRRIAVQRRNGRFVKRPAFQRNDRCTSLIGAFRLNRPVFGGKQKRKLFASFRLNDPANVKITVRRKGKVVATTVRRRFEDGNGRTLRLRPKTRRRGDYRVTISAERGNRTATATLTTRRL